MNWTEVKIATTHEGIEPVTALLLELGVTGIVVQDAADFEEFLKTASPRWDYVDESLESLRTCETTLTVYLPVNAQGAGELAALEEGLDRMRRLDEGGVYGRLRILTELVDEEDWANNWKQYFKPMPVGKRLLIRPTWETLREEDAQGRAVLSIDPGASFGTGGHHTTRLCLELLEETVRGGETMLDMGCGSGILGIAAMLLGAKCVTAVDVDENSVRIAGENFAENGVDISSVRRLCGDVTTDAALLETLQSEGGYELITANIVADVILAMLPILRELLRPDGRLILSGIISERADEVEAGVLAQGLCVQKRTGSGGWVALSCGEA